MSSDASVERFEEATRERETEKAILIGQWFAEREGIAP